MYDHPANEFVLDLPRSGHPLDGAWVRPHDLVVHRAGGDRPPGAVAGAVTRITRLGFEVKVDVALADGSDCWVQLSRGSAAELGLEAGQQVWVARAETAAPERPEELFVPVGTPDPS